MDYLTDEYINEINKIKLLRFYIGDLISKVEKNKIGYTKIAKMTASLMGPIEIYIDKSKEKIPVYYFLLDGGSDLIELTDSLENYLKIIRMLEQNSEYLDTEDLAYTNKEKYKKIINFIKNIDSNIEFWDTIIC